MLRRRGSVINFVTRRTFDGVMVEGQYGIGNQYHQWDTNLTAGTTWDSGALTFHTTMPFTMPFLATTAATWKHVSGRERQPLPSRATRHVQVGDCNLRIAIYRAATAVAKPNQCNNALGTRIYPSERRDSVYGRFAQDIGQAIKVDRLRLLYTAPVGVQNGPYQALSPLTVTPRESVFAGAPDRHRDLAERLFSGQWTRGWAQQIKLNTFGITPTVSAERGRGAGR